MKRLILFVISVCAFLSANPIDTSPTIYELQIIASNDWKIEVNMFNGGYFSVDSFMVKNKSDSAIVNTYTRHDSSDMGTFIVFTQGDLSKVLELDKNNDKITLCCFSDSSKYEKTLKIGTYTNSYLHNISSNQSICWDMYSGMYYKSNTPTIGEPNNFEAAKIYGQIFDNEGSVISNATVKFYPGNVYWGEYIDSDGYYQARYSPRYLRFSEFFIRHDNGFGQTWEITPVELDLEPGDSIEVNFYSTMTSIKPVIQLPIMLNNYPQPATDYSWFVIGNTDIEASAMSIYVYDLSGRKVDTIIPRSYQYRYDCSHLPQGSYIMSLQKGNKILASKKLQILK